MNRQPNISGSKIYITRSNSDRSPRGELNFHERLQEIGIQVVFLEQMSLTEQIETVSNAEAVVGPHGAGLANIAFLEPGSKVIELSSGNRFESCYRRIAVLSNLDYTYLGIRGNAEDQFGLFLEEDFERIQHFLT